MENEAALIPVAIGGIAMATSGFVQYYERVRYYRAYKQPLPEGALPAAAGGDLPSARQDLLASTMHVAVGSPGVNCADAALALTAQNQLDDHVGAVLVIENDVTHRRRFEERLPAVYDDRIHLAAVEDYGGGFANQDAAAVLDTIEEWGPAVQRATLAAIDTQLRRAGSRPPAVCFVHLSLGGQAMLGLPAVKLIHQRFGRGTLILATIPLPRHEHLRNRFPELKVRYEAAGVTGWIVSDNLSESVTTTDYGLVALPVGLTDAARHAEQVTAPNNTFALALAETPGSVLVYEVVSSYVVSQPWPPPPVPPATFYVLKNPLVVQIERVLADLADGRGLWSANLPLYERGTSTFDIVLANISHTNLLTIADEVRAGLSLRTTYATSKGKPDPHRPPRYGDPNYDLAFASLAAPVSPARPVCPVIGVRLASVRDIDGLPEHIAKVPTIRELVPPPKRLPSPRRKALSAGAAEGQDAHAVELPQEVADEHA